MKRRGYTLVAVVSFWGSTLLSRSASCDYLEFRAGGRVQLPTRVDGDCVTLQGPDGPHAFPRSDFLAIVAHLEPSEEWPKRSAAASQGDAQAQFAAAWWALENGLTSEAVTMLRAAHQRDPKHQPTARLVAVLDQLEASSPDAGPETLSGLSHATFRIARSNHFVLFHQHDGAEAALRLRLLENVLCSFYLSFGAHGFALTVPRQRLVSMYFARKADYLAYLKHEGAGNFLTTRGYYQPTKRTVATYDSRSDSPLKTRFDRVQNQIRTQENLRKQLAEMGSHDRVPIVFGAEAPQTLTRRELEARIDRLQSAIDRESLLLDLERRELDDGTAAHELIHQLVAESGLALRHGSFPYWLHEGLAMQFEVIRGGRWAGIGRVNALRLTEWRRSGSSARLTPLLRDRDFGQGYHSGPYAQAWALVYFLRKAHPDSFASWLEMLRASTTETKTNSERFMATFRSCFGADFDALDAEWHAYLRQLLANPAQATNAAGSTSSNRSN
jgi:hypothetical protein